MIGSKYGGRSRASISSWYLFTRTDERYGYRWSVMLILFFTFTMLPVVLSISSILFYAWIYSLDVIIISNVKSTKCTIGLKCVINIFIGTILALTKQDNECDEFEHIDTHWCLSTLSALYRINHFYNFWINGDLKCKNLLCRIL